jgi:ribosomal protein S18 acetylase RimI-like enzyme
MSESTAITHQPDSQPLIIDRATPADAEGLVNVHGKAWIDTYPNEELGITPEAIRIRVEGEHGELLPEKVERWKKELTDEGDNRATFVARIDGNVTGFVISRYVDDQRQIAAMYVLPDAQGQGIGTKLMQKALEWWGRDEDVYLHVVSYNQHAIDFYERFGFNKTGAEVTSNIAPMSDGNYLPQTEMILKSKT